MKNLLLSLLLLLGTCLGPAADRPNFIVLLTDDQSHDSLGVAGHPVIRTPHLDELASEGVRFTNAYVTDSICSVSRACILSGQYPIRNGIQVLDTPLETEAFERTYVGRLREAGYRTGHVGKWHLGETDLAKPFFDDWRGFEGYAVHYDQEDENGEPIHLTRKLGNEAVSLIEAYAEDDRPFCLNLWFQAPHNEAYDHRNRDAAEGYLPDEAFLDLYTDWTPEKPPTFYEFQQSIPQILHPNLELRRRWERRFSDEDIRVRVMRNYARLITGVDDVVGRVRAALEEAGLAENTVIVFLSDNGYFLGEHGLGGKFWPHEPSVRVPMIWFDPALGAEQRGRTRSEVALNMDVAPTLLDYARLGEDAEMQGASVRPLLEGEKAPDWREDFYYQHLYQAYREMEEGLSLPAIPACEGVVGGRYKYFRFIRAEEHEELSGEPPLYECLYDLESDPLERFNLAGRLDHLPELRRLRTRLEELKRNAAP